jgi:hypothetical protein
MHRDRARLAERIGPRNLGEKSVPGGQEKLRRPNPFEGLLPERLAHRIAHHQRPDQRRASHYGSEHHAQMRPQAKAQAAKD